MPTIDERVMALDRKGYKTMLKTHSAGRYEWLEENYPSKHGHWTITYTDPETGKSECTGFIADAIVGYSWAQAAGRTSLTYGGVRATIQDCLDEIEERVARQEAKIEAEHPDRCQSCLYLKGHGWGCPVYKAEKAAKDGS